MKKQYTSPSMKAYNVKVNEILAGSGGVGNGAMLGNEYNSEDASYGKKNNYYPDDEDWD